jgi:hypothetical protein
MISQLPVGICAVLIIRDLTFGLLSSHAALLDSPSTSADSLEIGSGEGFMSKKPSFFDFSNVEFPKIDVWGIVTLPLQLLGRAAIDSGPEAQTYRPLTGDVAGEMKSNLCPILLADISMKARQY